MTVREEGLRANGRRCGNDSSKGMRAWIGASRVNTQQPRRMPRLRDDPETKSAYLP
jgi:hypothetical protein